MNRSLGRAANYVYQPRERFVSKAPMDPQPAIQSSLVIGHDFPPLSFEPLVIEELHLHGEFVVEVSEPFDLMLMCGLDVGVAAEPRVIQAEGSESLIEREQRGDACDSLYVPDVHRFAAS